MIPLFKIQELENYTATDKIPLKCEFCGKTFYSIKKEIRKVLNNHPSVKLKFCSRKCGFDSRITLKEVVCKNCEKTFNKYPNQIKKSKNNFCSHSCTATYNNKHKTTGINRSKLEIWLETQLNNLYPNLDIHYNHSNDIGYELDIYIPSLKLAFELNGIYHYEPIFGKNKLQRTQNNDNNKFQQCQKHKISLCTIDTSLQKYFKEQNSIKYLEIITSIINNNLV